MKMNFLNSSYLFNNADAYIDRVAQRFINDYIDYFYGANPSGAKVSKLTIKGPDGGVTDKNNWYTDPAAREAVIAAYNAFCNIGPDVQNELNKLFVMDDNGNPCTFYSYMLGMRQLADNGSGTKFDSTIPKPEMLLTDVWLGTRKK